MTHFDLYQTFSDKIESHIKPNICANQDYLLKLVSEMALLLVKQSIQNVEYCKHSPSVIVIASFYAATAFLKHSKNFESPITSHFCSEVRRLIFNLMHNDT